jgi:hypothetical protein
VFVLAAALLIHNVTVIDPASRAVRPNADVCIAGERIAGLLARNPLDDIANTRSIVMVMTRGVVVKQLVTPSVSEGPGRSGGAPMDEHRDPRATRPLPHARGDR